MLQWTLSGKQISKSKPHIIYNTRHICWKTPVMLRPPTPKCWFTYHLFAIGHFRAPPGLGIKTRLSAQPLIWKWFFILMQIKLVFTRTVVHLVSFWKWGFLDFGTWRWPVKLESQHCARREEVLSGKRWICWSSRRNMKNPHFQSTVSTKFDEFVGHFYIAVPYIDGEATLLSSRTSTF